MERRRTFNRPPRPRPRRYLDRRAVLHRLAVVDMTPTEASRRAGLHPSYLSKMLRRDSPSLTPATREALARVLGVDVTTLHDPRKAAPPTLKPAGNRSPMKPRPPQTVAAKPPRSVTTVFVEPGLVVTGAVKVTRRRAVPTRAAGRPKAAARRAAGRR